MTPTELYIFCNLKENDYDTCVEYIESRDAAQRQAGREEMSSAEYVLRLISEPDPWYRDMNPKKQVELIRDRARKALSDLDEGKGQ